MLRSNRPSQTRNGNGPEPEIKWDHHAAEWIIITDKSTVRGTVPLYDGEVGRTCRCSDDGMIISGYE